MAKDLNKEYGPLAGLIGEWEGKQGDDTAPSEDRGTENNKYREHMRFEPMGMVNNHEQTLYALRYATTAWRIGEADPFHEELGYWLWDAKAKQVMRCFMVPRGSTILAGGTAQPTATSFEMVAELGSKTFGILSNPYLDVEFKTIRYELKVSVSGDSLTYEEDTQLIIKGQSKIFHHIDKNKLKRKK